MNVVFRFDGKGCRCAEFETRAEAERFMAESGHRDCMLAVMNTLYAKNAACKCGGSPAYGLHLPRLGEIIGPLCRPCIERKRETVRMIEAWAALRWWLYAIDVEKGNPRKPFDG